MPAPITPDQLRPGHAYCDGNPFAEDHTKATWVRRVLSRLDYNGQDSVFFETVAATRHDSAFNPSTRYGISYRGLDIYLVPTQQFCDQARLRHTGHDIELVGQEIEDIPCEPTLLLLEDEIRAGRKQGLSGQLLSSMCSARNDLIALRQGLWVAAQGLRGDMRVWTPCIEGWGRADNAPGLRTFASQVLVTGQPEPLDSLQSGQSQAADLPDQPPGLG